MLTLLRRHVSWSIKVLLAVIIVTFVFFFGYRFGEDGNPQQTAFIVGKKHIPLSYFRFQFDNQYENFRERFQGGEIPPALEASFKESIQRQLVMQTLTEQFAKNLGMHISDEELAKHITEEKDFDPIAYRNFIKNFYDRFGFSYEELIRQNLLLQKFQTWSQKIEPVVANVPKNGEWNFETVIISGEEKKEIADAIIKSWQQKKDPAPLLKKENLSLEKVEAVTLQNKNRLFGQENVTLEEYLKLFSLKPRSALAEPIKKEKKFLVARLTSFQPAKEIKKDKEIKPSEQKDFFAKRRLLDAWFDSFVQKTPVEILLKTDS